MIVDFHTHIFPDKMAARTVEILKGHIKDNRNYEAPVFSDGTLAGLKKSMHDNKVNLSIVLPIATTSKQTKTINDFAENIRDNEVISFGSLHPMEEDFEEVMEDLKRRGFKGIKLHPEYQKVDIDSKESIRIFKKAEELGLIVVYHAGVDVGMSGHVHSTPLMLSHVLEYVKGDKIIAAHMGGFDMWDDVMKYIVGTPVYLDTAVCAQYMNKEQYYRIIKEHGSDKIVLGSDSPWESPAMTVKALDELGLTNEELDNIKYVNAMKLLGTF